MLIFIVMKKKFSKLSLLLSVALFSNISFSQDNRNYFPLVGGDSYVGYKERYNPIGGLTNIGGGIGLLISSHNNIPYQKIKIFIPPGTKGLGVGLLTSMGSQESKMAARFKSPPIATAENINVNTGILDPNISLELLINGASSNKELYFYSPPNSGTLSTFRYNSRSTYQTDTGGYIYLNTLSIPGSYIKSLQATLTIDEACYRSWYANAQWDAQGNPDENASHTCAGSTGGGSSGDGSQVAAAEISGKSETVDTNGNLIINFKLKRPASETQNTNRTSFWIAAYVPAGFLPEDAWFFLTPSGWQQLASTNPYTVAYQNSQAAQPEKIFNISTGLSAADLRHFNAQLHFGYMGNDGQLKDMGMIWSGN